MSRKNANLNSMNSNGVNTTPPKPYRVASGSPTNQTPPHPPSGSRFLQQQQTASASDALSASTSQLFGASNLSQLCLSSQLQTQTQAQMQAQQASVLNAASAPIPIQVPLSALQMGSINIPLQIQLPGGLSTTINIPLTITTAPATSQQQQQTQPPAAELSAASAALTAIPAAAASSVSIEQHASRVHFSDFKFDSSNSLNMVQMHVFFTSINFTCTRSSIKTSVIGLITRKNEK